MVRRRTIKPGPHKLAVKILRRTGKRLYISKVVIRTHKEDILGNGVLLVTRGHSPNETDENSDLGKELNEV